MTPLGFIVPGRLDQLTGGYLFDRRIVEGLRARGRSVAVEEIAGRFPEGDAAGRAALAGALRRQPDGAAIALDGLALAGLHGSAAAPRLRIVGFVHHPLALETGLAPDAAARYAALEAELLPRLRGVICPSRRTAAAVAGYGVAASRIAVVPPGTAKPGARPDPPRAGPPVLLCVATLTPRKGHLLLVEALARLRDLDWRLVLVGSLERDPATSASVRASVELAGLAGRTRFAGECPPERIGAAYAAADCFVLPSFHEGYGMAYAEAMAYGLPVIGTTAGAIPELVPETAGILVPPGDVDALAGALRRLVGDAAERRRLAGGARAAGALLPGWPDTVERWEAAFDRLAA